MVESDKMMLGIVGTRRGTKEQKETLFKYLDNLTNFEIVSGGCYAGADKWAEEYAEKNGIKIIIHKPKGYNATDFRARNTLIANDSEKLIAVLPPEPDMKRFAGTEQTLREAQQLGKECIIINSENEVIE